MTRDTVLAELARRIAALVAPHPVRVAVDGIDAAGKTTFADALVPNLAALGRPVLRASVDDFQRPRAERYRRGADSPEGYYLDAFDYAALRAELLDPLGPGGSRRYRTATFDLAADTARPSRRMTAPAKAILVVDGVFLQRPELAGAWDYAIFLAVPFDVALARARERDAARPDAPDDIAGRYLRRYLPGQRRYLETVRPQQLADAVVDNADPARPRLLRSR